MKTVAFLNPSLPLIHLQPGDLVFTEKPASVVTVLGSCITVTMFSLWPRCAGICHAMLSQPPAHHRGPHTPGRFKYLSEAIPFMANHFRKLGIPPHTIEVKMFGGGNLTAHDRPTGRSGMPIGSANIETARQLLAAESLTLIAANVGGLLGRKLIFNTQTGQVMHKHLSRISQQTE
jgi:chemotaxis protein CheD